MCAQVSDPTIMEDKDFVCALCHDDLLQFQYKETDDTLQNDRYRHDTMNMPNSEDETNPKVPYEDETNSKVQYEDETSSNVYYEAQTRERYAESEPHEILPTTQQY